MDDTSALAAPPPLTIYPRGGAMRAVAEVLRRRLPGAELSATVGVAPATGSPDPGAGLTAPVRHRGARPALVLASADTSLDEVAQVLTEVAARHPRQARVWIAVAAGVAPDTLRALDDLLDDLERPLVDAVLVVPTGSGPAATALAVEAWVWLRHDAPSGALMDLRDANGACRFAAIGATAPAAPPMVTAAATSAPSSGEHAVLLLRRGLDEIEQQARAAATADVARVVASAADSALPGDLTPAPPAAAPEALSRIVDTVDAQDVAGLLAAERACTEEEARQAAGSASDADLAAAVRAVVQAQTAWQVEASRTGLAAKIGRRKRLEQARAERDAALAAWSRTYTEAAAAAARRTATDQLAPRFAAAALAAQSTAELRTADQRRQATQRWLTEARGAAAAVHLPGHVDPGGLSRAWGRAAPAVRRYLVVPGPPPGATEDAAFDASALAAGGDPGEVMVMFAPDLRGPIAAALVMGVPLTALRIDPVPG